MCLLFRLLIQSNCHILRFLNHVFNVSALTLDDAVLKYFVTEVVLFSVVVLRQFSGHRVAVLESSRTSPRPRGSSRTMWKSLVLALALRLASLTPSLSCSLLYKLFINERIDGCVESAELTLR